MHTRALLHELDRIAISDATTGNGADCRAKALSAGEFEEIFAEYQPLVFGIALKFMGNPEDAEDVTQEVFTKVWKSLEAFNSSSSLKTWIYRIAVNTCIDHSRKPWKKLGLRSTGLDDSLEENDGVALVSRAESAEGKLIAKEKAAQIRKAIARLRPHLKAVLVLKDLEELSYDEISSVLGVSMGTISSRLNRARKALMDLFGPAAQTMPQES
jgi:RNA polymerase sigma-70 factor, ECF subfamily